MSEVISDFIKRASLKTVADAVRKLDLKLPRVVDAGMKCPACGGKDRFAVNPAKGVWICRGAGGGRNGLGLVGHVLKLDLHNRDQLLEACSFILSESIPDGDRTESAQERLDREARLTAALEEAAREETNEKQGQNAHRERAVQQARGIYRNALMAPHPDDRILRQYMRLRTGFDMPDAMFENIRFSQRLTYWANERDEFGREVEIHAGYAIIAPFVDLSGYVTGCHQTWIDLDNGPKFRPHLGCDRNGRPYPTKKMRGVKMGSLIPVVGDLEAARWVGGEGIENVAAYAGFEGFRGDTFYFAAGDLGNLAGPADPESGFSHPTLTIEDKLGRRKRVRVQGPIPRAGQSASAAYQVADHVDELIHLADGDSEPVATAAAMARAEARCARSGRFIHTLWPPAGTDFSSLRADVQLSGSALT